MQLAELLEAMMIVSFGISWPLSIIRSYRSRSTKGKSVLFSFFILFGYICGISSKLMTHNHNLAFYFYILNITMVSIDICLYFRNLRLEKQISEKAPPKRAVVREGLSRLLFGRKIEAVAKAFQIGSRAPRVFCDGITEVVGIRPGSACIYTVYVSVDLLVCRIEKERDVDGGRVRHLCFL